MPAKILVLDGHPGGGSLVSALAERYAATCRTQGAEVRVLAVRDLDFNPNLGASYRERTAAEPDLLRAQEDLRWCTHLAVFFPTWWGATPALLKGFFDRALLPGFAFRYKPNSVLWDRLLTGRSARVITTQHTPAWYNAWIYRNSNVRSVRAQTLAFVGFRPVRLTVLSWFRIRPVPIEKFYLRIERAARQDCR